MLCVGLLLVLFGVKQYVDFLDTPPTHFPQGVDIVVPQGATQSSVADMLAEEGVVRSSLLLHLTLVRSFADEFVLAGVYRFTEPMGTSQVAEAITRGTHKSPSLVLTLPEGFLTGDFYNYLPEGYVHDAEQQLAEYEGYLFPDTYYISPEMTIDDIVLMLRDTMERRLAPYAERMTERGMSAHELLTFASILEREANDETSMRLVSSVLHNRMELGMALQVDATFDYLLGKTSAELTMDDLAIDSPYNTYTNRGLPPTPIANPGIMAIEATLYPAESDYYYYLTGNDGIFYYAETFDEHVANKSKHLR